MPELFLVCGPNGAGKSTWTKSITSRRNLVCIDTDALAASGLSPLAAGKASAAMAKALIQQRISFARESTLTAKFDFHIIEHAKKAGYTIHLVYIRLESAEIALTRVRSRVAQGGHNVPPADVIRRFQRSLDNLPKAMRMVDSYLILDNSAHGYREVEDMSFPSTDKL